VTHDDAVRSHAAACAAYITDRNQSKWPELNCGMATLLTFACSVCEKSFGESHSRCAQHVKALRGNCRRKGAVVQPVHIIVGRNDRNVGGRQLQPGLRDRTGGQSADAMLPGAESAAVDATADLEPEGGAGDGSGMSDSGAPPTAAGDSGTYPKYPCISTHHHTLPYKSATSEVAVLWHG
jgi:hypothetical protein